jgi:virulence-associated protein VapD
MNNNLESMLKEYQDNILKLRNVYKRIEQKLKQEGFKQEDSDIFLDKKFKEINKMHLKQRLQQQQNNITNKSTSNNNNNYNNYNNNNFPLYF